MTEAERRLLLVVANVLSTMELPRALVIALGVAVEAVEDEGAALKRAIDVLNRG